MAKKLPTLRLKVSSLLRVVFERDFTAVIECLRVFTRFPQTTRVFFGGAHDNGYTSTLNYLSNEGLHHKLTILLGYKALAPEVRSLNLPTLEIDGLFLKDKLQSTNFKKLNTPPTPARDQKPTPQAQDFEKFRNKNGFQPPGYPARKTKQMTIGVVSTSSAYPACCLRSGYSLHINVCQRVSPACHNI